MVILQSNINVILNTINNYIGSFYYEWTHQSLFSKSLINPLQSHPFTNAKRVTIVTHESIILNMFSYGA
jgi:hypothetical protein